MTNLKRLLRVWWTLASREAQIQLLTSWAGVLFIIGKVVRFLLYFVFLFSVTRAAGSLAGYSVDEVIVFFLVYTLVDSLVQVLFRGIYTFRFRVVSGDYDLDMAKPWPAFFRPVFGSPDFLDFLTLVPFTVYFMWFYFSHFSRLAEAPTMVAGGGGSLFAFSLLLLNSLLLAFSFHLFVAAMTIATLSVDHLVWIYRDLTSMARFPADIYSRGIRFFLTFVFPVVVLMTVPAKALLGLLSWPAVAGSFAVGLISVLFSLKFWKTTLRRYTSASS